jgi:peptidoglycan/LPS O-acetylase OafA/YrhL
MQAIISRREIRALTGLRGVAAVWVCVFHFRLLVWDVWGESHTPLVDNGFFGVDIFFILSGFILAHVHLYDFQTFSAQRLKRFAALRFFRIYPLHAFVMFGLLLLVILLPSYAEFFAAKIHDPQRFALSRFIPSLILIQQWGFYPGTTPWNGVTWTLSAEVLAYTGFPVLAFVILRIRSKWVCLAAALSLLLLLGLILHRMGNYNVFYKGGIVRVAFDFTAGVLLNQFYRLEERQPIIYLGMVSAALALICTCLPSLTLLIYSCFGVMLLALSYPEDLLAKIIESRSIMFLGEISFSLYISHYILLIFIDWILVSPSFGLTHGAQVILVVISPLVLLAFAILLNIYVERPTRNIGRNFIKRMQPVP